MAPLKSEVYANAVQTVDFIRGRLSEGLKQPKVGIVCGSGLNGLADAVRDDREKTEIGYNAIPNFPESTVHGHAGKLLFGLMGDVEVPVVVMVGRVHFYEGHSIQDTTFPIRVLKLLGIEILIVTNAAGGLNSTYHVGDLVVLNDHLNLAGLTGVHPLRGPNIEEFGTRFPPLSDAYDLDLRRQAHLHWKGKVAERTSSTRRLHEGVYAYVGGPSYETRAECRMLQMLGADVVGMSTVPEVIVARHCGLRVLAFSLVTNLAILNPGPKGDDPEIADKDQHALTNAHAAGKANHQEVLEAGMEAAKDMQALVFDVVTAIGK